MAGVLAVVLDHQDKDPLRRLSVNDTVRGARHRKAAPAPVSRRPQARVAQEKSGNAPELRDKPGRQDGGSLRLVERSGLRDVSLCTRMEPDAHPEKRACSRAMASSSGTATTVPASNSASRSSAS